MKKHGEYITSIERLRKTRNLTLREYIATRPAAEQENFWNAPAKPMAEIMKHREFWVMVWHRHIYKKLIEFTGILISGALILYVFYLYFSTYFNRG